ncbi:MULTISPECIES: InlB B-repeat-containing protein [Holdemanella]|uniref:InlB B-repeat-containing protein n=2 Tax=Erysipelotrichaceae TaxID=128827 RepID=UPI0022E3001B|nr:InlB B-repeat-containing protein [Holdemanella biformis]
MKNMKKFITLCGFLILGSIACGDVDIVKAEAINNQAADTSGYTITIPSDVDIDNDSGKGSFAVTGKVKAQSTIDVSIQSKNGYKLKDKNGELPYSIDKKSFSIDNSRSASDIPLNEEFNIVSKTNTKVSGYYTDSLTFDITDKKYEYELDVNGNLDENGFGDGALAKFGRFDVYIDGKLYRKDADDFCNVLPYGSTWELKNIHGLDGYRYEESLKIPTKGVIGENIEDITGKYRTTRVNLKFYTNKLTINYHADGAQTWNNFQNIIQDVSNKDIAYSETKKYGDTFDSQDGLVNVNRLTKKGYTAVANTWTIKKLENKKVMDNIGLAKSQDVAEYCGVLDSFKKNDTTIDLYPIWIPNAYTLTYDLNGGSFNASTTQRFKYESEDAISSEIPIKSGYSFAGWKWGDVTMQPGDTIPKECGNFTLTAQWKKQYTLTFDANGGTVSETSRTITEGNQIGSLPTPNKDGYRFYGWYGISDGTDWQTSYLILGSSIMKQDLKIVASWGPPVETLAKQNESTLPDGIYKIYSGISSFSDYNLKPRSENSNDENQILLKKEDTSEYAFWEVEHDSSGFVMFKNRKTGKYLDLASAFATSKRQIQLYSENGTYAQKWIVVNKNGKYQIISAVNPNFVLDLSNATLDGGDFGVVQLYYDNGTFAQRWVFEKIYTPGTIVNIDNNDYIMLQHKERNKYLLLKRKVVGMRAFNESYDTNTYLRSDGKYTNTYGNSEIDKYLENDWYERLPNEVKNAIQISDIKQTAYNSPSNMFDSTLDDWSVSDVGYNAQTYTVLQRHVYLPSMEELGQFINLNNKDTIKTYLKTVNDTEIYSIWTRDVDSKKANALHLNAFYGCLDNSPTQYTYHIAPAFVIDLSKIDYTVTGSANYK